MVAPWLRAVPKGGARIRLFPHKFPVRGAASVLGRLRRRPAPHGPGPRRQVRLEGRRGPGRHGAMARLPGQRRAATTWSSTARPPGSDYVYMHLRRKHRPREGERVRTGEQIGRVGSIRQLQRLPPALRDLDAPRLVRRRARDAVGQQAAEAMGPLELAAYARPAWSRTSAAVRFPRVRSEARFPRLGRQAGHYESFYLKASRPAGGQGVWIRHTVHKRPGEEPTAALWLTVFDADAPGPRATKASFAATELSAPEGAYIRVDGAVLEPGRATGELATPEPRGELGSQLRRSRAGRSTTCPTSGSTKRRCPAPSSSAPTRAHASRAR